MIYKKYNLINITDYVNLWLALAKLKIDINEFSKTISYLKKALTESKIFTKDELEPFEYVNIIIAMSSLKIDDKEFLKIIVDILENKIKLLDKDDLVNLARSFIVYVR